MFKKILDDRLNQISGGGNKPTCKCLCYCAEICACNAITGDDVSSYLAGSMTFAVDSTAASSSSDWRPHS